ncbi:MULTISPECIES: hypothetical protein [Holospora]|nr:MULTISPECIES: hypothetical protein [Holospora]
MRYKRSGPTQPKRVLSLTQHHVLSKSRRISKLSLDEVYIALKDTSPN